MSDLIAGSALQHFSTLVAELGGDAEGLLRRHGVDPAVIGATDRLVSYGLCATVVGAAALELDCPDFAMRLARKQGIQILGPVAVLVRHAATVGEAIEGVCRYLYHCAPPDIAQLRRTAHSAVFTLEIALRQVAYRDHWIEKGLMIATEAFRLMLGPEFAPRRVTMQHRRISEASVYRAFFGCPVEFGGEFNSVHLPIEVLGQPIPGHDPTILALAENYLAQVGPALPLVEHVRELIHRMLKIDQANLVGVARALLLHPRVLERRLAELGTTFERILDDTRRELAWELSGRMTRASQIATMLGYAEQASYSRACRRWYGQTPRQLIARRYGGRVQETTAPAHLGVASYVAK